MMVSDLLPAVFKPILDLIDDMYTSEEEKARAKLDLIKVQNEATASALAFDNEVLKSKSAIIVAEASGASWLQRNWRPITMLAFLLLVVCDSFGILTNRLAPEAWLLLQMGIGGYVVGRTAEKVTEVIKNGKAN